MIMTPRQIKQVRTAMEQHGLLEIDFDFSIDKIEFKVQYLKEDFYFLFTNRTLPDTTTASVANLTMAVASGAHYPFTLEYKPAFISGASTTPGRYAIASWDNAVYHLDRWLAWIKREYGPFNTLDSTISKEPEATPPVPVLISTVQQAAPRLMTEETIIRNAAKAAAERAEALGPKINPDPFVKELVEASLRFRKTDSKILFFEEATRRVHTMLEDHRKTCRSGPGCALELKYDEILYYIGQELDLLPQLDKKANQPEQVIITSNAVEKIFISHSSKDALLVEEVIELLEVVGIKSEQIFCSSFEGYSIGLGQDFLQRIKDELNSNVLVLFVLTPNFYNSPVSLCEMGAAWVRTSKHIPIVVPPLSYEDVKGVIPLTQGFKINEVKKWNVLKGQLEQWFALHPIGLSVWERKRDRAIQIINEKIVRATPKPVEETPNPKAHGNSDLSHFGGISV